MQPLINPIQSNRRRSNILLAATLFLVALTFFGAIIFAYL
jgi:hypothetical protein